MALVGYSKGDIFSLNEMDRSDEVDVVVIWRLEYQILMERNPVILRAI
jgi:hypothetical protein